MSATGGKPSNARRLGPVLENAGAHSHRSARLWNPPGRLSNSAADDDTDAGLHGLDASARNGSRGSSSSRRFCAKDRLHLGSGGSGRRPRPADCGSAPCRRHAGVGAFDSPLVEAADRTASRCGTPKMTTLESSRYGGVNPSLFSPRLCARTATASTSSWRLPARTRRRFTPSSAFFPFHFSTRATAVGPLDFQAGWRGIVRFAGPGRPSPKSAASSAAGISAAAGAAESGTRGVWCPYCDTSDHDELVSLVPENGGSNAVIDACRRCLGYVKTLTRLQGCPADTVMIEDLASVDLDIAAIEDGYRVPKAPGMPSITVTDRRRSPSGGLPRGSYNILRRFIAHRFGRPRSAAPPGGARSRRRTQAKPQAGSNAGCVRPGGQARSVPARSRRSEAGSIRRMAASLQSGVRGGIRRRRIRYGAGYF